MFGWFKKKEPEPSILDQLADLGVVGPIELKFIEDVVGPSGMLVPQVRKIREYIDFGTLRKRDW